MARRPPANNNNAMAMSHTSAFVGGGQNWVCCRCQTVNHLNVVKCVGKRTVEVQRKVVTSGREQIYTDKQVVYCAHPRCQVCRHR